MDVIKKVDSLIKKHETNCPFRIAKERGILVLYQELGGALGYYSKNFRIPIIHINESAPEKQQEFICAHELGHAVLHPDHNTSFLKKHTLFSTDKMEVEANQFALQLLFKSENTISCTTLIEAFEEYKIPDNFDIRFSIT